MYKWFREPCTEKKSLEFTSTKTTKKREYDESHLTTMAGHTAWFVQKYFPMSQSCLEKSSRHYEKIRSYLGEKFSIFRKGSALYHLVAKNKKSKRTSKPTMKMHLNHLLGELRCNHRSQRAYQCGDPYETPILLKSIKRLSMVSLSINTNFRFG